MGLWANALTAAQPHSPNTNKKAAREGGLVVFRG